MRGVELTGQSFAGVVGENGDVLARAVEKAATTYGHFLLGLISKEAASKGVALMPLAEPS